MSFINLTHRKYIKAQPLELDRYIYIYTLGNIIRDWKVKPIVVNNDYEVIEGLDRYWSLYALNIERIPIIDENTDTYISLDTLDVYEDIKYKLKDTRVYYNTLDLLVRNVTPLVLLRYPEIDNVSVFAKLEWYNPFSHSIKDRTVYKMIEQSISDKKIGYNSLLYEVTSTNTGIAIAAISNILGFKFTAFVPSVYYNNSKPIFDSYGVKVEKLDASTTIEALYQVLERARRDNAIVLNQFENDANFVAHINTAKEIDYQLRSIDVKPDVFVGGLGTSGHSSSNIFLSKK